MTIPNDPVPTVSSNTPIVKTTQTPAVVPSLVDTPVASSKPEAFPVSDSSSSMAISTIHRRATITSSDASATRPRRPTYSTTPNTSSANRAGYFNGIPGAVGATGTRNRSKSQSAAPSSNSSLPSLPMPISPLIQSTPKVTGTCVSATGSPSAKTRPSTNTVMSMSKTAYSPLYVRPSYHMRPSSSGTLSDTKPAPVEYQPQTSRPRRVSRPLSDLRRTDKFVTVSSQLIPSDERPDYGWSRNTPGNVMGSKHSLSKLGKSGGETEKKRWSSSTLAKLKKWRPLSLTNEKFTITTRAEAYIQQEQESEPERLVEENMKPIRLPDIAVPGTTTAGNRYIAISIPVECDPFRPSVSGDRPSFFLEKGPLGTANPGISSSALAAAAASQGAPALHPLANNSQQLPNQKPAPQRPLTAPSQSESPSASQIDAASQSLPQPFSADSNSSGSSTNTRSDKSNNISSTTSSNCDKLQRSGVAAESPAQQQQASRKQQQQSGAVIETQQQQEQYLKSPDSAKQYSPGLSRFSQSPCSSVSASVSSPTSMFSLLLTSTSLSPATPSSISQHRSLVRSHSHSRPRMPYRSASGTIMAHHASIDQLQPQVSPSLLTPETQPLSGRRGTIHSYRQSLDCDRAISSTAPTESGSDCGYADSVTTMTTVTSYNGGDPKRPSMLTQLQQQQQQHQAAGLAPTTSKDITVTNTGTSTTTTVTIPRRRHGTVSGSMGQESINQLLLQAAHPQPMRPIPDIPPIAAQKARLAQLQAVRLAAKKEDVEHEASAAANNGKARTENCTRQKENVAKLAPIIVADGIFKRDGKTSPAPESARSKPSPAEWRRSRQERVHEKKMRDIERARSSQCNSVIFTDGNLESPTVPAIFSGPTLSCVMTIADVAPQEMPAPPKPDLRAIRRSLVSPIREKFPIRTPSMTIDSRRQSSRLSVYQTPESDIAGRRSVRSSVSTNFSTSRLSQISREAQRSDSPPLRPTSRGSITETVISTASAPQVTEERRRSSRYVEQYDLRDMERRLRKLERANGDAVVRMLEPALANLDRTLMTLYEGRVVEWVSEAAESRRSRILFESLESQSNPRTPMSSVCGGERTFRLSRGPE